MMEKKYVLYELRPYEMAPLSIWFDNMSLSSLRDNHLS